MTTRRSRSASSVAVPSSGAERFCAYARAPRFAAHGAQVQLPVVADQNTTTGSATNRRWQLSQDLVEHRLRIGHRVADDAAAPRPWPSAAPAPPCVSLNSRAFWIAITAWSAKVLQQLDLLVGERPCGRAVHVIAPTPRSCHSIGAISAEAVAGRAPISRKTVGDARHAQDVWVVQHPALADRVALDRLRRSRSREEAADILGVFAATSRGAR